MSRVKINLDRVTSFNDSWGYNGVEGGFSTMYHVKVFINGISKYHKMTRSAKLAQESIEFLKELYIACGITPEVVN